MHNLLEQIIAAKKQEIAAKKGLLPIRELVAMIGDCRPTKSLCNSITSGNGIIAEFKRKSPSGGRLNFHSLEETVNFYHEQDVSGISILTDHEFFGGSLDDLKRTSDLTNKPLLRKDFILDEYQLFEARAFGADAVLLIGAILDEYHAKNLATVAKSLNLEVLFEIHKREELSLISDAVDIIGVNNRNLDTLEISLDNSIKLAPALPMNFVKISESGIKTPEEIVHLAELGYQGYLIGESLLREPALLGKLTKTLKPITYES